MEVGRMPGEWIFLYGPPGVGKSATGRLLAQQLGLPFTDPDEHVERTVGMSVAQVFAERGEATFRGLEQQALEDILRGSPGVVALGGGSLLDDDTRKKVEAKGQVVCLSAGPAVLARRLKSAPVHRPLLAGDLEEQLGKLLEGRAVHYASFALQVDNRNLSPGETVWQVQASLGWFHVSGMGEGYEVRITNGSLNRLGEALCHHGLHGPVIVVSDERVASLYAGNVLRSLSSAGFKVDLLTFPAGEESKTLGTTQYLWQMFSQCRLERGGTVIALGGGVVGDVAGFAAATFMRGIAWVAVPTSLLAMVDASVGGKTGIDLPHGKNLVGAFHAPRLVWADPDVLSSLPERELHNGLAEVVKAGLVGDPILFEACRVGVGLGKERRPEIIRRAAAVKARLVQEDPFEQGPRAALNAGHTVGHALEVLSKYELSHGEAVSMGLVAEARLAEAGGLAPAGLVEQIAEALSASDLPVTIPAEVPLEGLVSAMQMDKKKAGGKLVFSLPAGIGEVLTGIAIQPEEVLAHLAQVEGSG